MKRADYGIIILLIGIVIGAYVLFLMDVGVKANTNGLLDDLYKQNPTIVHDKFANNDLLNRRLCYTIVAAIFCLSGVILIAAEENKDSKVLLAHSRGQTKILSMIAAQQADIDAEQLNAIIKEINDENPLLFVMPDVEEG